MKKITKSFLELFFNPGETICVSADKYAYHSVDQDELNEPILLISSNEKVAPKYITEDSINLVALNPIKGNRNDSNVTGFRSFLVEMDDGSLKEQKDYIENSGLPYSICVFSGNKSLHYGIVLDVDFSSINLWRFTNQWILNILKKADQQTKNPSRSIRFPDNIRIDGKKKLQALVDIKGRVSKAQLSEWLNQHEDKKPIIDKPIRRKVEGGMPSLDKLSESTIDCLDNGVQTERNQTWFKMACDFANAGFEIDATLRFLENHFEEEVDFKRSEWEICIKSAYKRIHGS